jgi:hypothetical protein
VWHELPMDVMRELIDPKYEGVCHGKRTTSNAGCRGPLCRKAERDNKREQRQAYDRAHGIERKEYKRSPERIKLDEELNRIMAWHWLAMSEPKEAAVAS